MYAFVTLFCFFGLFRPAFAATAEQWRGRSIYQVIIDRYALPAGADTNNCPPGTRTWCGGTWNTLRENLDYIQNAGFTAVWISPVSQNYEGPSTPYGDAYHGYWIADATQLNDKFGTADDLKALSDELHRRGMYLMVDAVVNNVMATSLKPDLSSYMFKNWSQYHTYCPVDYSNLTSEQNCWLGDTVVPLPDVDTEDPGVISAYQTWIKSLVQQFNIDGLRIDAAKHVKASFWPQFCGAAGVFCIGEVDDANVDLVASYQGPGALDSTLNYPMYNALVQAFTIPGEQNISAVTDMMAEQRAKNPDPGLLGNFLEDQDLPRWANLSVDPRSLSNAMVFNFMSDGIPIVYYGQEQGFSGNADPYNREALWPSGYANTSTYQLITTLNKFRNFLVNGTSDWLHSNATVLTTAHQGIAIQKGNVISILTNMGSPPENTSIAVYTPWPTNTATLDVLSCTQWAVGSNGTVEVQYSTQGGVPVVLSRTADLVGSGLCGYTQEAITASSRGAAEASSAYFELRKPNLFTTSGVLTISVGVGLLATFIGL